MEEQSFEMRDVKKKGTIPNAIFVNDTFGGIVWFPRGMHDHKQFSVVRFELNGGEIIENTLIRYSASPYRWRAVKGKYSIFRKDRDIMISIIKFIFEKGNMVSIPKRSDDISVYEIKTEEHFYLPEEKEIEPYMADWGFVPIKHNKENMAKPLNMCEDNEYIIITSEKQTYIYKKERE